MDYGRNKQTAGTPFFTVGEGSNLQFESRAPEDDINLNNWQAGQASANQVRISQAIGSRAIFSDTVLKAPAESASVSTPESIAASPEGRLGVITSAGPAPVLEGSDSAPESLVFNPRDIYPSGDGVNRATESAIESVKSIINAGDISAAYENYQALRAAYGSNTEGGHS